MNAGNKIRRILCNHQPLIVLITMGMLLGLASASPAQVLRGERGVRAEDSPAKASGASAPQVHGQPGAPDATTTISGIRSAAIRSSAA